MKWALFILAAFSLAASNSWAATTNASEYLKQAFAESEKGDQESALRDFNKAIQLDPANEQALAGRAAAYAKIGNIREALNDFNRAIELNSKDAKIYRSRGAVRTQIGDFSGALADYNRSLELDPNQGAVYHDRAAIKFRQGDLDEAIADDGKAIELDPGDITNYLNRAQARYMRNRLDEAADDFREALKRDASPHRIYKAFLIWVVESKGHSLDAAGKNLNAWLGSQNKGGFDAWSLKVADFLTGRIDEKTFIAAAVSTDSRSDSSQQCEAWYYAGTRKLREGQTETAADYFRKCLATSEAEYREYQFAELELDLLNQPLR